MFTLNDTYYVEFSANGKVLPFQPGLFQKATITQNVAQALPMLTITFRDPSNTLLRDYALTEGTKIEVRMGTKQDRDAPTAIPFRVVTTSPSHFHGTGTVCTIKAIFDAPKLYSIAKGVYTGSASAVIEQLANEIGLRPVVDATRDEQNWIPFKQSYKTFLHHIAEHAYADDNSIFSLAIRETGELVFANLDRLLDKRPETLLYYGPQPPASDRTPNRVQIVQQRARDRSGVANLLENYGASLFTEFLKEAVEEIEQFSLRKFTSFISMNRTIKNLVGKVASWPTLIDTGNANKNFNKGEYQNTRGRATFQTYVDVLSPFVTHAELLQMVKVHIMRPQINEAEDMFSGNYIVTGKARIIQATTYGEKLELVAQGRGLDPQGDLF